MAETREVRQKLRITIGALLAVDLAAVALLISPVVGSERSRREESTQLWKELQMKTRQVEPLRDMDKKILAARQQIDDFYKTRLPAQNSAISDGLGKLAAENGVKIGQIKYKEEKNTVAVGLQPMEIEADFSGDYLHLVRFINALERAPLFFLVNSVELGGEQGGLVKLQLKLETYLKASA
jgi:Tfp pilus assembly protein PilO